MVFSFARTSRESHPREEVEASGVALVCRYASITNVVIAVWPHAVSRCSIAGPPKVSHCPNARPEAHGIASPRKRDARFHISALEAHLVPRLYHAGAVVEVVILKSVEADVESPIFGGHCIWVVPLSKLSKYSCSRSSIISPPDPSSHHTTDPWPESTRRHHRRTSGHRH